MMRVEHNLDQCSFNFCWCSTRVRDVARSNERGLLHRARIRMVKNNRAGFLEEGADIPTTWVL